MPKSEARNGNNGFFVMRALSSSSAIRHSDFVIRVRDFANALRLLLQIADNADQRHEQRDDDGSHHDCQKNDHDRFQHGGQSRYRIIDFVVVDISNLYQHFGKLPGLFANVDHADYHWRKCAAGFERLNDGFALLYAVMYLTDRAGNYRVVSGGARDVECLQNRDATGNKCSESS